MKHYLIQVKSILNERDLDCIHAYDIIMMSDLSASAVHCGCAGETRMWTIMLAGLCLSFCGLVFHFIFLFLMTCAHQPSKNVVK
jgi:hypothetical protein